MTNINYIAKAVAMCLHGSTDDLETILSHHDYETSGAVNGEFILTGENGVKFSVTIAKAPNIYGEP